LIFIDRQIKLYEMQLETLDTSKIDDFYEVRIIKAVIRQLNRMKSQGQVNVTQEQLNKFRRFWRNQLMD